jgi:hypothetical protein
MNVPSTPKDTDALDVPLSRGGGVYDLLRLIGLRPDAGRAGLTAIVVALVAWLPLLLLSLQANVAIGDRVSVPFLKDITAFARFLIAIPLFVLAGPFVDFRLSAALSRIVKTGLIPQSRRSDFDGALRRLQKGCSSRIPDLLMLGVAWTLAWLDLTQGAHSAVSSWMSGESGRSLSLAGWYYSIVSLPIFTVLSLRWFWRLILWALFLNRVSKLDLDVIPTHPDKAGGLGGLAEASLAFNMVVAAFSVTLGANVASRILYAGESLDNSKLVIGAFVIIAALLFLGPLLVFTRPLGRARFKGLLAYGDLADDYVRSFDRKWMRRSVRSKPDGDRVQESGEALLGSADVQSLADIGGSFQRVVDMKPVLVTPKMLISLAISALGPMLPPLSTVVPIMDILAKLASMLAR